MLKNLLDNFKIRGYYIVIRSEWRIKEVRLCQDLMEQDRMARDRIPAKVGEKVVARVKDKVVKVKAVARDKEDKAEAAVRAKDRAVREHLKMSGHIY